jgi:DNA-directed RNA polymerase subunit RPC12/RpoP
MMNPVYCDECGEEMVEVDFPDNAHELATTASYVCPNCGEEIDVEVLFHAYEDEDEE